MIDAFNGAFRGSLIGDALAMPVHWYYDRAALDRDYPELNRFVAPRAEHPDSIFWRSEYEPLNEKGDILHDQAKYWGQRGVHYHQNLAAGENTVNFKLARSLYDQCQERGSYDVRAWAERYIELMLTPGWHGDTYLEEYHRGYFQRYAAGKDPLKCGIRDEHIGGIAHVPALFAALPDMPLEELRAVVKTHVALTHRHSNVLRAADCLVRLLYHIANGQDLREAVMAGAGDWFSTRKALKWETRPDRDIVGQVLSPACYIDQAFPAALYLAWKYHGHLAAALLANAKVGGDSCHRASVVGGLVAVAHPEQVGEALEKFGQLHE